MTQYAFLGAIEHGLLFSLMALGVFLTFRALDFPDLSVDGSFPLGAAVCAVCITKGVNPYAAVLCPLLRVLVPDLSLRFSILNLKY